MKKVLFIHHGKGIGGAPTSMSLIANEMNKSNLHVEVLFLFKSDAIKLFSNLTYHVVGLPIFYFNHTSHWVKLYRIHVILSQLFSWFFTLFFIAPYWYLKLKPDVVYLNSSVLTDWSMAAKLLKIPNLVHVREAVANGHFGIRKRIISLILDYSAETVLYLSEHNYNRLKTSRTKSFVIPNYVKDLNSKAKSHDKEFDFIYVGGQKEIKGIQIIEHYLLVKNDNIKVVLLGYYSEDFVKRYSACENVHIVGVVPNILDYLRKSKFLIFPASTPHFPRPVIEAYSVGTIPIVTNLDGINEIVNDGETGFLFENRSISSLLDVMETAQAAQYDLIVKNGSNLFKTKFGVGNERKIIALLTKLAKLEV